jgi:hypothetical protein
VASAQEVICAQRVRPSQRNVCVGSWAIFEMDFGLSPATFEADFGLSVALFETCFGLSAATDVRVPALCNPRHPGTAASTHDPHRALFARFVKIDFEGNQLANARADSIAREGGDMNEQLFDAGARLDEAETTLVVPFDQCAVHSHQQSTQVSGDRLHSPHHLDNTGLVALNPIAQFSFETLIDEPAPEVTEADHHRGITPVKPQHVAASLLSERPDLQALTPILTIVEGHCPNRVWPFVLLASAHLAVSLNGSSVAAADCG